MEKLPFQSKEITSEYVANVIDNTIELLGEVKEKWREIIPLALAIAEHPMNEMTELLEKHDLPPREASDILAYFAALDLIVNDYEKKYGGTVLFDADKGGMYDN